MPHLVERTHALSGVEQKLSVLALFPLLLAPRPRSRPLAGNLGPQHCRLHHPYRGAAWAVAPIGANCGGTLAAGLAVASTSIPFVTPLTPETLRTSASAQLFW